MADYDDPRRPSEEHQGDEAWFAPGPPPAPAPATPPGVVYEVSSSGRDAYRDLRNMGADDPVWPLEDPGQPQARPPRSRIPPFLIGLLVGVSLTVGSVAIFQLFSQNDEPSPAAATTVPATVATTLPPPTSTTAAPTTVTTSPPVSSTTIAPPEPIEAVGRPVEVDELRMAANSIGPDIRIGRPTSEALGRLVASLGPPDEDSGVIVTDGRFGACVGDTVRFVRWGPLMTVNLIDEDGASTFAGYRLDLALGGLESRASTLSTLSGLRAGDTVAELIAVYDDFTVEIFEEPGVGLFYQIVRVGQTDVLLWGPVTSADDDGIVTGIWAPDACTTG